MNLLPGQVLVNGVSNLIFGTNMSQDWATNNSRNNSQIQSLIKSGGFTIMRCLIPQNSSLAYIDQTVQACKNMNVIMLVILHHSDLAWNQTLVTHLGNNCNLYEFSNEPDLIPISSSQYSGFWNQHIPVLRKINANASFIGPVLGVFGSFDNYVVPWLQECVKSGVLPDAISYHIYPCTGSQWTQSVCDSRATSFSSAFTHADTQVKSVLGKSLPICLTEWNIDANSPPQQHTYATDPAFAPQWMTRALDDMVIAGYAMCCQWDAAGNAGSGTFDLINTNTLQPQIGYLPMVNSIKKYLGGITPTPVPTPTPTPSGNTPLSLTPSNVPALNLIIANQLYTTINSTQPSNTWSYTRVGKNTGFVMLSHTTITNPPVISSFSPLTYIPSGKGFLLDQSLSGNTIPKGTWKGNVRLNCAENGDVNSQSGTITADIHLLVYRYDKLKDTMDFIVDINSMNATIPANYTTLAISGNQSSDMSFSNNEFLYFEYGVNILTNTNNSDVLDIRFNRLSTDVTNKTGDSNESIISPGYIQTPVVVPPIITPKSTSKDGPFTVTTTPMTFTHSLGQVPDLVLVSNASLGNVSINYSTMTATTFELTSDMTSTSVYTYSMKLN